MLGPRGLTNGSTNYVRLIYLADQLALPHMGGWRDYRRNALHALRAFDACRMRRLHCRCTSGSCVARPQTEVLPYRVATKESSGVAEETESVGCCPVRT